MISLVDKDGNVLSEQEFRAKHPKVSFPRDLKQEHVADFGHAILHRVDGPEPSEFYTTETDTHSKNADGSRSMTWKQTPISADDAKALMRARIAYQSHEARTKSVTVEGITVKADASSLMYLRSAIDTASGAGTINFKAESGWAQLSRDSLYAIVDAINQQIQRAFDNEFKLVSEVNSLEATEDISKFDFTKGW